MSADTRAVRANEPGDACKMARMDRKLIALNRFGLGRRAGESMRDDPVTWLLGQLDGVGERGPAATATLTSGEILGRLSDMREQREALGGKDPVREKALDVEIGKLCTNQYIGQVARRLSSAVSSETPFLERLEHFWSNHFAVSGDNAQLKAVVGSFEQEAIRPRVMGRFEDMLVAAEHHPAMLIYLDQSRSVGPNSPLAAAATRSKRNFGLNENLAREILELHTLGVTGGYNQSDVKEFARALTGWTIAMKGATAFPEPVLSGREPGEVLFEERVHEPGTRAIAGRTYPQAGASQPRAVLADLARHPSTARHISFKLARHFVADDPPEQLVRRLEKAYLASGGDLPSVYRALVEAPEAWTPARAKFRTPWLWTIAILRALGQAGDEIRGSWQEAWIPGILGGLGQPIWQPLSPAGFDDVAESWAAPNALVRRVGFAETIGRRASAHLDARKLADELFAQSLSAKTRDSLAAARTPAIGLALLLVSPEMLRC